MLLPLLPPPPPLPPLLLLSLYHYCHHRRHRHLIKKVCATFVNGATANLPFTVVGHDAGHKAQRIATTLLTRWRRILAAADVDNFDEVGYRLMDIFTDMCVGMCINMCIDFARTSG